MFDCFEKKTCMLRANLEESEDTNGVMRIRISKKNWQQNAQRKKYKDKQRSMKHTHKSKDGVTRTSLSRGWTNPRAPEWYAVPAPLSSTIIKPNFAINSLINILKTRWTFVYVFWKIFPTMQSCWFHPLYRYKIVFVGFHISVCSSFCLHYFCQDFLSSCRKCIMQVWCTSDFFFFYKS